MALKRKRTKVSRTKFRKSCAYGEDNEPKLKAVLDTPIAAYLKR
jgi:hypothetical protein